MSERIERMIEDFGPAQKLAVRTLEAASTFISEEGFHEASTKLDRAIEQLVVRIEETNRG